MQFFVVYRHDLCADGRFLCDHYNEKGLDLDVGQFSVLFNHSFQIF